MQIRPYKRHVIIFRDVWGKKVIRQIFSGNHTDIILKRMKETEFSNSESIEFFRLATNSLQMPVNLKAKDKL